MRGLTVYRPWNWAFARGKRIENRPQKPPRTVLGQRIALHAGHVYDFDALAFIAQRTGGVRIPNALELPPGVITSTALLIGWVHASGTSGELLPEEAAAALADPWFMGPYGWVLRDFIELAEPVPARGMQGLWPLAAEVAQRVLELESAALQRMSS